jgi:pyruvate,water dikinase
VIVHRAAAAVRHPDIDRWVVDIGDATDPALCGGKASGLARLRRAGFAVPAAICLTTAFYRRWLETSGIAPHIAYALRSMRADAEVRQALLAELRLRVEAAPMPEELEAALRAGVAGLDRGWDGQLCVRSSAADEDRADTSHAGVHASLVTGGGDPGAVVEALKACWASLWTDAAWAYRQRGIVPVQPAMAVVVQRWIAAERSGVAFSADPLTSDRDTVVIEACRGAGADLVSGKITPERHRITVRAGAPAARHHRRDEPITSPNGNGVRAPVADDHRAGPVLTGRQALDLAQLVKAVEHRFEFPVDVEWVHDGVTFWAVQARPITTLADPSAPASYQPTVWTRANLKEIFPELPSPLALSYLSVSLNRMFRSYHGSQGYALPADARLVSVFRGRPYLNLTLMQQMTAARGGDPRLATRLFGGRDTPGPLPAPVPIRGIRAWLRVVQEMLETVLITPRRGRRLFRRVGRDAAALDAVPLDRLDDRALLAHLERFRERLLRETTMRRLHEIVSAQSRAYMALDLLLAAWIPSGAHALVTRLMTGLGTLPNARMTYRLAALGAVAQGEASARSFLAGELGAEAVRGYRTTLAGTRFLEALDEFLHEFGHRGPYESDVMSARFDEDPGPVLRLVQVHLRAGAREDLARHAAERSAIRQTARTEVREALRRGRSRLASGWRWLAFSMVCGSLQRLLALRDECRHVMTSMVAHLRQVLLEIGRRATRAGVLDSPDDMFFLAWYEVPRVLGEPHRDWRSVALARRRQRERDARLDAPDLLVGGEAIDGNGGTPGEPGLGDLVGLGVSPGTVTGTVKVLRSPDDVPRLSGDIVVCATMEPTLTPIFPLVRGMVTEMGGLLSHAAILAREYGLPAVVNVRDATRQLRDGDRIELDGTTGHIRLLERCAG